MARVPFCVQKNIRNSRIFAYESLKNRDYYTYIFFFLLSGFRVREVLRRQALHHRVQARNRGILFIHILGVFTVLSVRNRINEFSGTRC